MTNEDFESLLERRLELTRNVLSKKATEYATGTDRLHNFKQAAAMMRCTPAQACVAFLTKHLVSIFDMVQSGSNPPPEVIDEKIGDANNYLILLEAIWKERPPCEHQ